MTCTSTKAPTPPCRSTFRCPALILLQASYMAFPVLRPSLEAAQAVHNRGSALTYVVKPMAAQTHCAP